MKFNLILFISILTYSCQNADVNDTSKRNEDWIYYTDEKSGEAKWVPVIKGKSSPLNGNFISFYSKGSIYEKGKLKNGKIADTIYCYNINEKLIKYKVVKTDTIVSHFIKDGPYKEYFQSGKIFEKGVVKNHEPWGVWRRYYENGNVQFIGKFKNKTGLNRWYFENGQISESVNYLNGELNGVVKIWYKNGQLEEICHWKNGIQDGIYETYYENGNLKEKENWINGQLDGKSEMWYENGQKKQLSFYKKGVEDGPILQWYSNGNKKAIFSFILGEPDGKLLTYHENGKVKNIGNYVNGKRHGEFILYDDNGKIEIKEFYRNGELLFL